LDPASFPDEEKVEIKRLPGTLLFVYKYNRVLSIYQQQQQPLRLFSNLFLLALFPLGENIQEKKEKEKENTSLSRARIDPLSCRMCSPLIDNDPL
jgi:hypothetical protein